MRRKLGGKKRFTMKPKDSAAPSLENLNKMMDEFEESVGVAFPTGDTKFTGFLTNAKSFKYKSEDSLKECAALLMYFVDESGNWIKSMLPYDPYFFIKCNPEVAKDMMPFLHKTFSDTILSIDFVKTKIDLSIPNHLSGITQLYLKLRFRNVQDLVETRNAIRPIVEANKLREQREGGYYQEFGGLRNEERENMMSYITEICEDDVLYHIRTMIDNDIRCSFWYNVSCRGAYIESMTRIEDKLEKGDIRIFAFDIETTKAPLKFPDAKIDSIMMISSMYEGQGYLYINRSIVSQEIEDFVYSPTPEFESSFIVINEPDEKAVLLRFFSHIRELKPLVISSFNADNFDFPFIEDRARSFGLSLEKEIGISREKEGYIGRYLMHMDCFYWVERDAYLPQGSHGLKAVTKAKLQYDPVELDPEEMLNFAQTRPHELAVYSASDAVATYYLYKKLIHDFIFALSTIIPTYPDEVLRLGSGTLCEALLMAEAFRSNIIFPNKHKEVFEKFHEGHLIDGETYIGGHVEALKNGVYRSDIPIKFRIERSVISELIESIDDTLKFIIEEEHKKKVEICANYMKVRDQILEKLKELLTDKPIECCPKIYHVDVAAMYPNIILTNRLQPVAIVNDKICASCMYNEVGNNCKRGMTWTWKADYFPLNRHEFEVVKRNLETEKFKSKDGEKLFSDLYIEERNTVTKQRVKKYCEKVYKKIHVSVTEERKDNVCMRENPFYVNTIRAFRDRRYEYKNKVKIWKGKYDEALKSGDSKKIEENGNLMNLFESLQLAHKIILNSFYGYVMRKGARWYSMQMAGMVTHLGGNIITFNREFIERLGIPLELDTDGIWCLLPSNFPEMYTLEYTDGKKMGMHYTVSILNMNTYNAYANNQYQTYNNETKTYDTKTEMSVFFEIDGPYRCIVLPAAREEGKMLKKKYAVFNMQGKLQELKGFEVKRRGELNIVKIFQSEVFSKFIQGKSLEECYGACAEIAERWYDVLDSEGLNLTNAELIEYIGEDRRLARSITAYGTQKSTAITCARRLSEFLGIDLTSDKGLNTRLIIAKKPTGKPIAERAIPTAIFSADPMVARKFLRIWLKDDSISDLDMKSIIDWDYYKERLAHTIQKIITIPAVLQGIPNPFPKVPLPEWLKKKMRESKEGQKKLDFFLAKEIESAVRPLHSDIEFFEMPRFSRREEIKEQFSKRTTQPEQEAKQIEIEEMQNSLKVLTSSAPLPAENFDSWIKHQQDIWKLERKLGVECRTGGPKSGILNYLKVQEENLGKATWHILDIKEMQNNPGFLKVWFIAEHEDRFQSTAFNLFSLNLHVKRIFYINSKVPQPEQKQAKKFLPRGKIAHYLYEMETEEEVFQDTCASFGSHLCSPNIEGIYEAGIPLSVRAIIQIGALVRPIKTKVSLNQAHITQTFNIGDFDTRFIANKIYCPSNSFEKVLLSHSCRQLRHVFGVFLYSARKAIIIVLHETIKQVEKPNVKRVFKQIMEETQNYQDWNVESYFSETMEEATKIILANIEEYNTTVKKPVFIVLQSPKSNNELSKMGLQTLYNEYPVIRAPVNDEDMNYPALYWQVSATKNIAQRFIENEEWFTELINIARTAGLPICCFEFDSFKYVIDILFAKKLFLSNHLLWYSEQGYPDFGLQSSYDPTMLFEEELGRIEIINPGVYRGYCVELSLSSLAIDTIMASDELSKIETGFAAYQYATPMETSALEKYDANDIFGVCMESFKKLKSMLMSWMIEIEAGNLYADRLMQHVYRWLSSPDSKMYDPALHRMVHILMTKIFLRLLQRFKEHGAQVVYATFHKVILYTGKHSIEETTNYIDFLTKTMQICDSGLYKFVIIDPTNYWRLLLFSDNYNFGGIQESQPTKIASSWNIAEFLPPVIEEILLNIIAEFTFMLSKYMKKKMEIKPEDQMEGIDPGIIYMKDLVKKHFSQKLFNLIPDLVRKREEDLEDSDSEESKIEYGVRGETGHKYKKRFERWEFPKHMASHLTLTNPALEFVKGVCAIFSLESELNEEVIILRRNCLKMIKVGEFAPEVEYENPCLTLVLQDVICNFCLIIKDIDVCRDSTALKGNWVCTNCNHSYNKEHIENKLISIVERRVRAYQIQDLKCDRCKAVKTHLLNTFCECTGKYRRTLSTGKHLNLLSYESSISHFLLLMKRLAENHHLELLRSIVDSI